MANNLTSSIENAILDHLHGVASLSITTPLKLALYENVPTDSVGGTEITGGSYARQTVVMGTAGGSTASNTNVPSFTLPTCTVAGWKIFDSSGTPKAIWQGPIAIERTYVSGDTLTFQVGDIQVGLR